MNVFGNSSKQLLQALIANAEKETMDYVLQEIQAVLGEEMPEADEVRTYLQDPDKPTELSTTQRIVAMDKLLECAEVNLRMLTSTHSGGMWAVCRCWTSKNRNLSFTRKPALCSRQRILKRWNPLMKEFPATLGKCSAGWRILSKVA